MSWYLKLKNSPSALATNGFAPDKDFNFNFNNAFADGGGDTFDNWGFFKAGPSSAPFDVLMPTDAMNSADYGVGYKYQIGDGYWLRVRISWVVPTVLMMEFLSDTRATPYVVAFGGDLGSDSSTQSGTVTTDVVGASSGSTYRLYTCWSNDGTISDTGGDPILMRTWVPYDATKNLVAAGNPCVYGVNNSAGTESSKTLEDPIGGTLFIHWGRISVNDFQTWLAANLEEVSSIPEFSMSTLAPQRMPGIILPLITRPLDNSHPISLMTPLIGNVSDIYRSGRGRVVGTVKEKNTPTNIPVRRRVRLVREFDGVLVREMWSDAITGAYGFYNIDETIRYSVISYDHEHDFRAVIADNLQPELMT